MTLASAKCGGFCGLFSIYFVRILCIQGDDDDDDDGDEGNNR